MLRKLKYLDCRWEGIIKMNLKGTGWVDVDWIQLAQARNQLWAVVDRVTNHLVP
jgi:hypothetical protein